MKIRKLCSCLLMGIVLLSGCGNAAKNSTSENTVEEVSAAQKSVSEIYEEIAQSVALVSPVEMPDEFIFNYGIDVDMLEEYVFVISEEATSAETVAIMKVKDRSNVGSIETALGIVINEKRTEMENYLPEQFAIVDKSSVKAKDSYVWLVISENQDDILAIIEENI